MKRELEKFGHNIEAVADKLFNHRLRLAQGEFEQIASQVSEFNIYQLPRNVILNINGTNLAPIDYYPGPDIRKFVHNYDDADDPKHIVYFLEKTDIPDQGFYLLLVPEILENGDLGLCMGIAKHDGKQFFTGWIDSRLNLDTRRYHGLKNHLALIQYNHIEDLDTYELLEYVKQYGAAFLYSTEIVEDLPHHNFTPGLLPA